MTFFETRYGAGVGQEITKVHHFQEALWEAAFGVESLAGLFDLTPAVEAIPVLDAAINRFNHSPATLRPFLDSQDALGLRGNRMLFEQMRQTLADFGDATISCVADGVP